MLGLYTRTPTCTANGTEFLKVQLKEYKTSWYFEVLPLSHHTTKSMEPLGFISTITDNSYKLLFCTMVWHKVLGCPTEVFNYHEIYYIFQGCAALYYSIWRAKFGGYLWWPFLVLKLALYEGGLRSICVSVMTASSLVLTRLLLSNGKMEIKFIQGVWKCSLLSSYHWYLARVTWVEFIALSKLQPRCVGFQILLSDHCIKSAAAPVRKDITSMFNMMLLFNGLGQSEQEDLLNEFTASSLTNMRTCICVCNRWFKHLKEVGAEGKIKYGPKHLKIL